MPRRRNNRNNMIIIDEPTYDNDYQPQEPIRPVKDFLKCKVWDLIKAQPNNDIECSICLDNIDCKKCYTILTCGHSYHLACVIKCETCPLCRS